MTGDYRSRIVTADEALAVVRSGQRVYIHNGCAEPVELVNALTRRGPELRDVEVNAESGPAFQFRDSKDLSMDGAVVR